MAVPSSGELRLASIRNEIENNVYEVTYTASATSLASASNGTYDTINTNNAAADRPDGNTPHAMSEFYNYDHHKSGSFSATMTVGSYFDSFQLTDGYGWSNSTSNPGDGDNIDGTFGSMSATSGFNGATLLNLYWSPSNVLIITFTGTKPSFNSLTIAGTNYGASSTWTSNGTNSWRKNQSGSPFGTTTGASKSISATF